MAQNFKQQAAQTRAAIPQVDPESTKVADETTAAPSQLAPQQVQPSVPYSFTAPPPPTQYEPPKQQIHLTVVNTRETPANRGFSMYPSRHRQVARDLAYVEDRKPWEIIEDALEEYVIKHYGKAYKRQ